MYEVGGIIRDVATDFCAVPIQFWSCLCAHLFCPVLKDEDSANYGSKCVSVWAHHGLFFLASVWEVGCVLPDVCVEIVVLCNLSLCAPASFEFFSSHVCQGTSSCCFMVRGPRSFVLIVSLLLCSFSDSTPNATWGSVYRRATIIDVFKCLMLLCVLFVSVHHRCAYATFSGRAFTRHRHTERCQFVKFVFRTRCDRV